MKTYISLLFTFFLAVQTTWAMEPLIEETRVIERSYNVNADAFLHINNRYGNVTMTSWDKNVIEIKIEIKVDGHNKNVIQERLNAISIDFSATKSAVTAYTKINEKKSPRNTNISINYFIKLPKTNNIDITNRYGNVYLDELKGSTKFNVDYGTMSIGKLHHAINDFNLDYITLAKIDYINIGKFNADYTKVDISKSKILTFQADYTEIKLDQVENVVSNMDYGNLVVNKADKISVNSDYSNIKVGTLNKSLVTSGDYGTVSVQKINHGFEKVMINANYATVNLGVDSSAKYSFIGNIKYGGLTYPKNLEMSKLIEKSTSKYYEGKTSSPSGKIELNIVYGSGKINLVN